MEISPTKLKARRIRLICVLAMSAAATVYGVGVAISVNDTPGPAGPAPSHWPTDTKISLAPQSPTLLVFAHPYCTCTQATFEELAQTLRRRRTDVPPPEVRILFYRPRGASWRASAIWQRATQIPGASVAWDEAGAEARRFGAGTSGATLLYASDGRLLFEGGVTGSRGHAGDNYGADKLAAALRLDPRNTDLRNTRAQSQVFGCPLFSASENSRGANR